MKTNCPICDGLINLNDSVEVAEIVSCTECKTRLEIISKEAKQLVLQEAPKVEEDWGE